MIQYSIALYYFFSVPFSGEGGSQSSALAQTFLDVASLLKIPAEHQISPEKEESLDLKHEGTSIFMPLPSATTDRGLDEENFAKDQVESTKPTLGNTTLQSICCWIRICFWT